MDNLDIIDGASDQYAMDRLLDFNTMSVGYVYRPTIGGLPVPIPMSCTVADPIGPPVGAIRMMRGGGYVDGATFCRSATRSLPDKGRYCGFRVARYTD